MFGLICNDDIPLVSHCLFLNFRSALYNLLGKEKFKEVRAAQDIDGITHLFIVDEHFGPNVDVWRNDDLINAVNERNIRVIIFNFENIFLSLFPWNITHQRNVERFNNRVQILTDMDDINHIGSPFVNKQLLSKDTYVKTRDIKKRTDKILFAGQMNGDVYSSRRQVIDSVSKVLELDVRCTDRRLTYDEFLDLISEYKYVLNPLGTGAFLNLRYYEIIKLGSIPIQQITQQMKKVYSELNENYSINFETADDLRSINKTDFIQKQDDLFLEDYLKQVDFLSLL